MLIRINSDLLRNLVLRPFNLRIYYLIAGRENERVSMGEKMASLNFIPDSIFIEDVNDFQVWIYHFVMVRRKISFYIISDGVAAGTFTIVRDKRENIQEATASYLEYSDDLHDVMVSYARNKFNLDSLDPYCLDGYVSGLIDYFSRFCMNCNLRAKIQEVNPAFDLQGMA